MTKMHVTEWGRFCIVYGVMTHPNYWRDLFVEVKDLADADRDWPLILEERIAGMTEMLETFRTHGVSLAAFEYKANPAKSLEGGE